jgi:hypothetical protein
VQIVADWFQGRQVYSLSRTTDIARAISRVTNPCFLSVVVLVLMAYIDFVEIWSAVGHIALILLCLVLLPIAYVLVRMARAGTRAERLGDLVDFLKEHPGDVGALGMVLGLPSILVLIAMDAPRCLVATLISLLVCSLIIALVRGFYRLSYHLAGVTCLIIMVAQTWGQVFFAMTAAIPLIVWSRYMLREHSLAQMLAGSILAVVVCIVILHSYGLC